VKRKIQIKRIYDNCNLSDGVRILIDRLWPRGLKKREAKVDEWIKDIAPSDELRKWFSHDPEKWNSFKVRYNKELKRKKELIEHIKILQREKGIITLLYSTKDEEHNNAVVLKNFLSR
jgi:uncharacterized protein YeaO (DUF488 family)